MKILKTKHNRRLAEIGCAPEDSQDLRLKKSLMTIMVIPYSFAAIIWGIYFMKDGNFRLGAIPFTYAFISLASFLYFAVSKRHKVFRFLQLLLVLIMPLIVQFSLGGFFTSGGMVVWSCTTPFLAVVFYNHKIALRCLWAAFAVVCVAFFADEYFQSRSTGILDEQSSIMIFSANFILASMLLFILLSHFAIGNKKIRIKLGERD